MPIKSKVFIQTLQKSQDRYNISFAFEFNNKNTKKVFGQICPPPQKKTIKLDLPPNTIRVNYVQIEERDRREISAQGQVPAQILVVLGSKIQPIEPLCKSVFI